MILMVWKKIILKFLGVDLGNVRTGIALGNSFGSLASPFKLIVEKSFKKVRMEILKLAEEEKIDGIVVGIPINLNGSYGEKANQCLKLVNWLKANSKLKIVGWDERNSTIQADSILNANSVKKTKKKQKIDLVAATLILQSYLDYLKLN